VQLDEDLCLCFHVTLRKVVNYLRVERPARASQISECFGAGTGCGWCRPYLKKLFEGAALGEQNPAELPSTDDYSRMRERYIDDGGGTPPGEG
jgi:NAD(P)H-nitrite reductase large subunit